MILKEHFRGIWSREMGWDAMISKEHFRGIWSQEMGVVREANGHHFIVHPFVFFYSAR